MLNGKVENGRGKITERYFSVFWTGWMENTQKNNERETTTIETTKKGELEKKSGRPPGHKTKELNVMNMNFIDFDYSLCCRFSNM